MEKTTKLFILGLVFGLFILPGIRVMAQQIIDTPPKQIDVDPVIIDEPGLIIDQGPVLINEETSAVEPTSGETMTRSIKTSDDVLLDENIMAQDLGVSEQRLLPTSPYYPIKTIWRGFRSILTFDPVKKVELNLQYANEKLIESKQMAQKEGNSEIVTKTLESYKKDLENVSKIVEKSSEEINMKSQDFAERMIDYSFKQQKLIDGIEKNLTPEQFERMNVVREDGLDYFGQTITNLIEPEQIRERITNVIESQIGSDFKDFKNIEVLKIIEEKIPEQAKQAIQQARENTTQRLQDKMTNMAEVEGNKFKEYIENVGGNEIRHLEIINDFTREEMPEFLHQEMKIIRDKAIGRIENKMQEFTNEEQKQEFFRHLEQGKMEDIRIIKELENNLAPETIEKMLEIKNNALENFRQEFEKIKTPEDQVEFLKKLEKLHDVKQLEVFKEIEQIIPQDKKEFFEQMKTKVVEEMEKEINLTTNDRERSIVLNRLAGDMPEHMEILRDFAPQSELMNEMFNKQANNVMEKILNIDDVEKMQNLKDRINNDSFIKQEFEKITPDIFQQVDNRIANQFEEISKERVIERLEKAKNEIDQTEKNFKELLTQKEIGEYLKNSPAPQHLANAKKLLQEAKTAFDQEKYGNSLGQINAAFNQLNSVWRFVKEFELKHEVAQKRVIEMEQTMENMVGDFLEIEIMEMETDEMPIDDKKSFDRAIQQVKEGNLEQAWEQYKDRLEEKSSEDTGELKEIDLPFEQMNLSNEQIQKIKEATRILPIEIRQKLQDLPAEMIIDAAKQIQNKIQQVPETTTQRVKERIEQRIEQGEELSPSSGETVPEKPIIEGKTMPEKPIIEGKIMPESPTEVEQIRPRIEPTEPIYLPGRTESEPCIQVITYAVSGGMCRAFPNPCVVPSGWQKVDKCPEKIMPENIMDGGNQNPLPPKPEEINKPTNIQPEQIRIEERKQFEGLPAPEGSLGKPSLLEKMKNLFR
ncbi:hypothetical protein KKG58_01260 [Patescibacteria group bacterium]|nr:hypothetical protein [Patescibacteria group bacterium]